MACPHSIMPGPQVERRNGWGLDDLKAGLSWACGPSTHMQTLQMAWALRRRDSRQQTLRLQDVVLVPSPWMSLTPHSVLRTKSPRPDDLGMGNQALPLVEEEQGNLAEEQVSGRQCQGCLWEHNFAQSHRDC